jgi:methylmalonyl-CoA mutase cobalamin-binding subunit
MALLTFEQQAVRAAIDKRVHIISMSWTIEKRAENETGISELESAIQEAARARILMFCAANDQGVDRDKSFPAGGREGEKSI